MIENFLTVHGAAAIPHPGGTLLEHLKRVRRRLAEWQASPDVQVAGLCHAAYGTDGFATALLGTDQRAELVALIGERAEELVYLYGSCDRKLTYPQFGREFPIAFHDRFTGTAHTPDEALTRAFAEITVANELDVVAHNPDSAAKYGAALSRLFTRMTPLLSLRAVRAFEIELAPRTAPEPPR